MHGKIPSKLVGSLSPARVSRPYGWRTEPRSARLFQPVAIRTGPPGALTAPRFAAAQRHRGSSSDFFHTTRRLRLGHAGQRDAQAAVSRQRLIAAVLGGAVEHLAASGRATLAGPLDGHRGPGYAP